VQDIASQEGRFAQTKQAVRLLPVELARRLRNCASKKCVRVSPFQYSRSPVDRVRRGRQVARAWRMQLSAAAGATLIVSHVWTTGRAVQSAGADPAAKRAFFIHGVELVYDRGVHRVVQRRYLLCLRLRLSAASSQDVGEDTGGDTG
jgi:hypothetical protein